ncbi:electron transfer flavoprotein-ubiquinone oxidoreductase [Marinomonas communis]|nr:electron transfer flavoprotein-ubiquinone oxidoreductase [Marinomonas communis]
MEREAMEFDLLIIGAGPAGLSTAYQFMKLAKEQNKEYSVCVVEKAAEVGGHILSGAVLDARALSELIPNWQALDAPLNVPVIQDDVYLFQTEQTARKLPNSLIPKTMHNDGKYVISLGNFCRWLASQVEDMGADIFPGFTASELLFDENDAVVGVITGDMGVAADGSEKDTFMPGMEIRAKYTVFAEGCRGHLGKQVMAKFGLANDADPQHYAIGLKELWEIDPALHQPGLVIHGAGWPLDNETSGGSFLYHGENNQVALGIIIDLSYSNPYLSPFDELQRLKHQAVFKKYLEGGKRLSYGARAITKGGLNALPKMHFPGGLIVGCDAGTLNFAKIKGTHTAMKSGMVAAEVLFSALAEERHHQDLEEFALAFKHSWAYEELYRSRNFGPAMHKFGTFWGGAFNFVDQNLCQGQLPLTLRDLTEDYTRLQPASKSKKIEYPKPDGVLSFDKLSSVFISNTNHEDNQPCHLVLKEPDIPLSGNLPLYDEPAQRYCPAGVYEVVESPQQGKEFKINSQNCLHCKTCDIKDPAQNITWVTPEGGGGPNYPNM